MSRTDTQVNFRLKTELLDRLRAAAESSGRTLTAELNYQLDRLTPAVEEVQVKIRLPADVHNLLRTASASNGRSLTQEIAVRLASTLFALAAKPDPAKPRRKG